MQYITQVFVMCKPELDSSVEEYPRTSPAKVLLSRKTFLEP